MLKETEEKDKSVNKYLENLDKDNGRIRVLVNNTRYQMEKVAKECMPFTDSEITHMKDIVNTKWQKVTEKIENLAQEVFDEVVEHEMALAKLETFDFE